VFGERAVRVVAAGECDAEQLVVAGEVVELDGRKRCLRGIATVGHGTQAPGKQARRGNHLAILRSLNEKTPVANPALVDPFSQPFIPGLI
jgi:hypothetical protein